MSDASVNGKLCDVRINDVNTQNNSTRLKHIYEQTLVSIERMYVVIMKDTSKAGMINDEYPSTEEKAREKCIKIIELFKSDFYDFTENKDHPTEIPTELKNKILKGCDGFIDAFK